MAFLKRETQLAFKLEWRQSGATLLLIYAYSVGDVELSRA